MRFRTHVEPMETRMLLSAAEPTALDQYMIELINRARLNPAAEAARFGIDLNEGLAPGTLGDEAREPIAINLFATSAAQKHTADLLANFDSLPADHRGSDGRDPSQRVADEAGGSVGGVAENNAWVSHSGALNKSAADKLHQLLFKDFTSAFEVVGRGHRKIMLSGTRNEAGAGLLSGKFGTRSAAVGTIDFFTSNANYITGVAFRDSVAKDNFYTPGEGLGGIAIVATPVGGGAPFQATTWAAGGYSLAVPDGAYNVVASGGGLAQPIEFNNVLVDGANVKVDFVTGGAAPAAPLPVLTIESLPDAAVTEGDAQTATIRVSRDKTDGDLAVKFKRSGTAKHGLKGDYLLSAGGTALAGTTVVIPAGQSFVDIVVTPVDDAQAEMPEALLITLAPNKAYALAADAAGRAASVQVSDNEPVVSVEAVDADAAEPGADRGTLRISLDQASPGPVTVRFKMKGTARQGADYIKPGNAVTIPAGEVFVDVDIVPLVDKRVEPDEVAQFILSRNRAYTLSPDAATSSAAITIADAALPEGADLVPLLLKTKAVRWMPGGGNKPYSTSGSIINQGSAAAGPFAVEMRLSRDRSWDNDDLSVFSGEFDGLAAGRKMTVKAAWADLPGLGEADAGDYYILFRVDSLDSVIEAVENNNFFASPLASFTLT